MKPAPPVTSRILGTWVSDAITTSRRLSTRSVPPQCDGFGEHAPRGSIRFRPGPGQEARAADVIQEAPGKERAGLLALFLPLIISSGGNSGSQATTLVIRAMALGEVRLKDWWHIVRRELAVGLGLGVVLACIGLVRVLAWQAAFHLYGAHAGLIALTVSLSLVGVVAWGTLSGALLPFVLRLFRFDPASASAPFVATLVDVSGLVIYFSVAEVVLRGTLL